MKHWWFYIIILLFSLGCNEIPDDENWLIVQGLFIVNEPFELNISRQGGGVPDVDRAFLREGVIEYELISNDSGNTWISPSGTTLQANVRYELVIETPERRISGWLNMPEQIDLIISSAQSFNIDPTSEGNPVFSVNWEVEEDESRVLKLESLELDQPEIPFSVPSGRFLITNGAPNTTSGAVLLDTDFLRYGLHRLTVYGVPEEYEDAFFYQPSSEDGLLDEGPDNILNGSGYVVGASQRVVTLDLLE